MPLDLICPKRATLHQVFVSKGVETAEQRDHGKCQSPQCLFFTKF